MKPSQRPTVPQRPKCFGTKKTIVNTDSPNVPTSQPFGTHKTLVNTGRPAVPPYRGSYVWDVRPDKGGDTEKTMPQTTVRISRRNPGERYLYWEVPCCPFCRGRHFHGAGNGSEPLLLLSRVSHCTPGGEYELIADTTHPPTMAALERHGSTTT